MFFSEASIVVGGNLAPMITWPLFMVFIILVSNFWGWVTGEWKNAGRKAISYIWLSVVVFVIAIIVFSISSTQKPQNNLRVIVHNSLSKAV